MPAISDLFKKYINRIFIETGSGAGDGIQSALDAGFQQVYSIELSPVMYNICIQKYIHEERVIFLGLGDSQNILPKIISKINEPMTFWLDAHASGGDTMGADLPPIMEELEIIKRHHIKTHNILIDDLRCWNWNDIIKKKLLEINPDYIVRLEDSSLFKNDIMAATIG